MKIIRFLIVVICVSLIAGCPFGVYAEDTDDLQNTPAYRFYEDFSGGKPTDTRFKQIGVASYAGGTSGTMKTKVQTTTKAGASVLTDIQGSNYYFECMAQFVFDVGFKMTIKDSNGAEEGIFYDSLNGELKDNAGNVVKSISTGSVTRKIGILVLSKKAYLFENDTLVCDMLINIENAAEIFFVWSNPGSLDYRPNLDNLLITTDESEFPSLPEEYTKSPSVVAVSVSDGEENVDISKNYITLDFDIAICDIKEGDVKLFYGDDNTQHSFLTQLSEDGKRLILTADGKLKPLSQYTLVLNTTILSKSGLIPMQEEYVISFGTADGKLEAGNINFEKTSDSILASVCVSNESSDALRATLILCVCFGTESEFITESAIQSECEILPGSSEEISVEFKGKLSDNSFIKALLWKSEEDMNPIIPGVVYVGDESSQSPVNPD